MLLFSLHDFHIPLENPVLIFATILFIILFAPILLNKVKIPHLIGLILAGAIIGPNGLNLILRDSSIVLFGTVGLLYIMFLAGLEIDMADFKKNSVKSIIFGMYTFIIPMILGTLAGYYILQFTLVTSILLASMFASHTLIAYPILSRLGVSKNRVVGITVGGTMITDTLALLTLAVIAGISTGELSQGFWWQLFISVLVFGAIVMIGFPFIGRWFFKRFDDRISQYIFVLGMVFLAAFLAQAAGIEPIIGAFLAGLALNRLIPSTSPLMNRIDFIGNALFIPFFLIGVGMLIDFKIFFSDFNTIFVAIVMTVAATVSKFLAAWMTQKTFRFSNDERRIIFGLSNAQAAATLAAILVGYNIILGYTDAGDPVRLLNDSVLNGTIIMILITCTMASFAAQKGGRNIALSDPTSNENDFIATQEKILIPINNIENTEELINLGITIKSKKNKKTGLFVLNIINNINSNEVAEKKSRKILEKASVTAAATDNYVQQLLRYDLNVINGISSVVKEHKITDLIIGLHHKKIISDSFLGELTEGILAKCNTTTFIYKSNQPLGTSKRHIIIIPDKAEKEIGFAFWIIKIWNIGRNTGAKMIFYASDNTLSYLKQVNAKHPLDAEFNEFSEWDEFLILSRNILPDDNLIIILSRKGYPSYNANMPKIPSYINKYFSNNSFILTYPILYISSGNENNDVVNQSVLEPLKENLEKFDDIGKTLAKLFKKKQKNNAKPIND